MPTYQYACTNPECSNRFELIQAFTDPAATACPVCGALVRKVYGSVGVVFKGSGFYRNDSRAAAAKASNGSDSKDAAAATKEPVKSGAKESSGSSGSSGSDSSGSGSGSSGSGSGTGSSDSGSSGSGGAGSKSGSGTSGKTAASA